MDFREDVVLKEALRYMGYKNARPEEDMLARIREVMEEVRLQADARNVYRRYSLTLEGDEIRTGVFTLRSKNLAKNLQGCVGCILFAATLGSRIDVLMNRYQKLNMTKAVILQAVAAAAIEDYCDDLNDMLRQQLYSEGLYLRPRFSPGYGDLSLEYQKDFLGALQAEKYAGITLTEGGIMLPEKSVSAIIGITPDSGGVSGGACHNAGCEECNAHSRCAYSRV